MTTYYYYGEFGYFNTIVLAELSKYFLKNPKDKLTIKTYTDYAVILRLIFGNHYTVETVGLVNNRVFHDSIYGQLSGELPLIDFLNCRKSLKDYEFTIKPLKKIRFGSELYDNKYKQYENIICIFPRHRKMFQEGLDFEQRNMTKLMFDDCVTIVNDTFISKKYKIIIVGKKAEILENDYSNFAMVDDINEMIYLLNNCALLITPDSGFIDFAKNCSTKNILIVTNIGYQQYHTRYNPYGTQQYAINFSDKQSVPRFRLDYCFKNTGFANMKTGKNRPFVSCICPTYNRRNFLPKLIEIFNNQKYPADLRELIILDDSETSNKDIVDGLNTFGNVRYIHSANKYPIGKKRNILNQLIHGEYVVCFDDDDYYPNDRVSHAITKMLGSKIGLCGSSKIFIYYTDIDKIYEFGPYGQNHCTNGTMGYHRNYLLTHCYNDEAKFAEESLFMNQYIEPMIQLDPYKSILCMAHGSNTFDKKKIINTGRPTSLKMDGFIQEKHLIKFYKSLNIK